MVGVANRAQDRKLGLFQAVVAAAILAHVALVAVTFSVALPWPADPAAAPAPPGDLDKIADIDRPKNIFLRTALLLF